MVTVNLTSRWTFLLLNDENIIIIIYLCVCDAFQDPERKNVRELNDKQTED